MQSPTDASLELARNALQNSLRVMTLWEETQQQVLQLQLKALADAIAGAHATAEKLAQANDWASFGALPVELLRDQSARQASVIQDTVQLFSAAQANMVSQMREATQTLQSSQASAFGRMPTPQIPVPATMQAWLETMGAINPLAAPWAAAAAGSVVPPRTNGGGSHRRGPTG